MSKSTRNTDYAELAQAEVDRADEWANRDNVELDTRNRMMHHAYTRAHIFALLSIAQEISKVPANLDSPIFHYNPEAGRFIPEQ